jgi:hypothetical protein
MDPKTAGIGAIAVAALVVAIAKPSTKEIVPVSVGEADVAVTEIAKTEPTLKTKVCGKVWAQVAPDPEPTLVWLCDGAYVAQQAWLDKTAGEDGQLVTLTPRQDGDKVVFDAMVTRGEDPPLPVVEAVKPEAEPVEDVGK